MQAVGRRTAAALAGQLPPAPGRRHCPSPSNPILRTAPTLSTAPLMLASLRRRTVCSRRRRPRDATTARWLSRTPARPRRKVMYRWAIGWGADMLGLGGIRG